MKQHPYLFGHVLLLGLSCLFVTVLCGGATRAQDWQTQAQADPMAGITRKIDEYGKVGYCDETARLDNFAITLQNEPSTKGYLLVYYGKDDLPAWTQGINGRAADYLVNSRGIEPERLKVVSAGYREERTMELWLVIDGDPAPEPSNTIEVKLDKTKAYQWDDKSIEVEYNYDPEAAKSQEGETQEAGDSDSEAATKAEAATKVEAATDSAATTKGKDATADSTASTADSAALNQSGGAVASEAATGEAVANAPTAGEANADARKAESAEEAEWRKEVEKYEIAIESRAKIEQEAVAVDSDAVEAGSQDESAADETDEIPQEGTVKLSVWWNVESFANVLKNETGSRACLIYYHDTKNASEDKVKEIVARGVAKMGEQFGLKSDQIFIIDGGYSAGPSVEFWVVPPGAALPKPKVDKKQVISFSTSPGEE
jgi:hypothetical protein